MKFSITNGIMCYFLSPLIRASLSWCQSVTVYYLRACCEQVLFLVVSVCLSVRTESRKLLTRNWFNLVGICPMGNARSGSKLATFDLDLNIESCLCTPRAIYFEWLDIATSFSVWRYIFRLSRSGFSFRVMGSRSRSRQWKSDSVQFKNYWL